MLEHPPLIHTDYTPEQIVGYGNMQALAGHIKHFEANKDKVSRPINAAMGQIITRLAEHGYYIDGVDSQGRVLFMVATKSEVQRKFEGPELQRLMQMPLKELQEMGRGGYLGIIRQQKAHKNI